MIPPNQQSLSKNVKSTGVLLNESLALKEGKCAQGLAFIFLHVLIFLWWCYFCFKFLSVMYRIVLRHQDSHNLS
jgi:hypothetical protein